MIYSASISLSYGGSEHCIVVNLQQFFRHSQMQRTVAKSTAKESVKNTHLQSYFLENVVNHAAQHTVRCAIPMKKRTRSICFSRSQSLATLTMSMRMHCASDVPTSRGQPEAQIKLSKGANNSAKYTQLYSLGL